MGGVSGTFWGPCVPLCSTLVEYCHPFRGLFSLFNSYGNLDARCCSVDRWSAGADARLAVNFQHPILILVEDARLASPLQRVVSPDDNNILHEIIY